MGVMQSFRASRVVGEECRAIRCLEHGPLWKRERNGRLAAVMFGFLATVSAAPALTTRAEARNSAPKNEEQERPAPPVAPADTPKGETLAPPVAPQDAPKVQTPAPPVAPQDTPRGETPAPPFDAPKEAPGARSDIQKKASAGRDGEQEEGGDQTVEALSLRYRFIERYSTVDDPTRADLVNQYQVATRDTVKVMRETPQAAPARSERTLQTRYTERAAQVSRLGVAMYTVRRYDKVRGSNAVRAADMKSPFLQGLKILYRRRPKQKPEVLSLVDGRSLREAEYAMISQEVFLPQLADLLPRKDVRVDDEWEISRDVARALWSELNDSKEFELVGTLKKVTKAAKGNSLIAVIGIQGQFWVADSPSAFNSEISFTFELPKADSPAAPTAEKSKEAGGRSGSVRPKSQKGIVEARGWITRALMSQVLVSQIDEGNSRLKETTTRELDVHRLTMAAALALTGEQVAPVEVPNPLPAPNEANSWLLFDDPAGRFNFRHPQELEIKSVGVLGVELNNSQLLGSHDALYIFLKPKGEDPNGNEAFRDPAQLERMLEARWAEAKVKATRGPSGKLPPGEWAPFKRTVYRIESAVDTPDSAQGNGKRIYTDDYLVTLGPARTVVFHSMTERDDHVAFRGDVESMIKSFQFGPAEGRAPAAPASPSSTSPPPR